MSGKPKLIVDELISRQVAAIAIINPNVTDIAKQLNISKELVRRVMDSRQFREILIDIGDSSLGPAIAKVRSQTAKLVNKALKVIEDKLDEGDLDAAKVVLKVLGVDNQEEKHQDTNLTVVLPNTVQASTIQQTIEVPDEAFQTVPPEDIN